MPPGLMYDNVITDQIKALLNPNLSNHWLFFTTAKTKKSFFVFNKIFSVMSVNF